MKKLVNKKELREKMNIAIDMLSSVKVTLGPKGENVIINQSLSSPFITNDGVTIASNIESDDIVVNTILELAKEASIKTLETAGDGTTTTLVLLEELYKEGVKLIDNKINPIIIKEQLNTEAQKVVSLLEKYSKKPTKKELLDIAITASNDIEIGKNICNAYLKVKDKDLIDIKETSNRSTTINYVKGYSFDTCIASYYYFKENVIKMDDVYVLITNKVINEIYEIEDILNVIINDNKNLIIIADDYGENLVNQMVSMYLDNNVSIVLLKNSSYGDAKNDFLVDIANISLGKIQNGNYKFKDLGLIRKVKIDKDKTVFNFLNNAKIKDEILSIKHNLSVCTSEYERNCLKSRLSMLDTGSVEILVGGITSTEIREKKMRYEDAKEAINDAYSGVLPGFGVIYLKISEELEDINYGTYLIKKCLKRPIMELINNSGLDFDIVDKIINNNYKELYNIKENCFENINDTSVFDSKQVDKEAFLNAISIAGMLLTTSCLIINEYNEKNNNNDL